MSAPASTSNIPPLDDTVGSIVVGLVLGTFLFGMLTVQVFNYSQIFHRDSLALKSLVAIIWFLELAHTIVGWHAGYTMVVTFYGQPEHISDPPVSMKLLPLFSGPISFLVESFFAFRIHALSNGWVLTVVCCIFNVANLALTLTLLVLVQKAPDFAAWPAVTRTVSVAASAVIPANNILITLGLCYYLWKMQAPVNRFSQTRTMIMTFILWTVESTVVTSAASFLQLIFLVTRKDLVWMIFYMMHGKLLSNCLLASLNGRNRFRPREPENGGLILTNSLRTRDRVVIGMTRITETFNDPNSQSKVQVADEHKTSGSN
ncbi:hypothetical protein C8R46DRAFT_1087837 [Mycena filopes]|nr:hypothetical protein C8R46DRAFT_1087837 [Mycena filopes]